MAEREDSIEARRAIRAAEWRGAWRMLGWQALVLIPAAILFPVFAQVRSSGVNKVNPARIAGGILAYRTSRGTWPTEFEPLRPFLRNVRPQHPYRVSFVPLKTSVAEATYAIGVDGRIETWRIDAAHGLSPIDRKPAFGTLPK